MTSIILLQVDGLQDKQDGEDVVSSVQCLIGILRCNIDHRGMLELEISSSADHQAIHHAIRRHGFHSKEVRK